MHAYIHAYLPTYLHTYIHTYIHIYIYIIFIHNYHIWPDVYTCDFFSIYFYLDLSIYLFVYASTDEYLQYVPIFLVYLSIFLSIHPSIHALTYLFFYIHIYHIYIYLYIYIYQYIMIWYHGTFSFHLCCTRSNTLQQMQEKEENLTEDIINLPLDEVADGFPFFPEMCRLTSCGILTLGPFPFFDVGRGSREGRPKVDSGQMTSADVLGRQEE